MSATPDEVEIHRVGHCQHCDEDLEQVVAQPVLEALRLAFLGNPFVPAFISAQAA